MGNKKYLYWLTDELSIEQQETETVWREMYSLVGVIVHVSQMLEYNLANIIAVKKMQIAVEKTESTTLIEFDGLKQKCEVEYKRINKLTLGKIIDELKKIDIFDSDKIENINEVLSQRNHIVHNVFKEDLFSKKFSDIMEVDGYIDTLNGVEERIKELNDYVVEIFKQNKIQSVVFDFKNN